MSNIAPSRLSAQEVVASARAMRLASDAFDAAISGWAELVAEGDFDAAEEVARVIFDQWDRHRREHPEWAARYADLAV